MKHIFSLIALALLLSSCGTFHKVVHRHEEDQTSDINTSTKVDADLSTQTDIAHKVNTVITERIDTQITVPGHSVVIARPLNELLEGKPLIAQEGEASVTISYDPTTGTVRAEGKSDSRVVPVQASKTTFVAEDYKSSQAAEQNIEAQEKTSIETDSHTETENKETLNKTSSGFGWGTLTGIILVLAVLTGLFYLKRRLF